MKAVRFDHYGDVDVLDVIDVAAPVAGEGQVVVRVEATGINPGEAAIRSGALHERWPATFPSGQGSDLAGVVTEVGSGVDGVSVGDEVIGYTDERASHAELVAVDAEHLAPRPGWEPDTPVTMDGGVREGRAAGARPLQQIRQNIHDTGRSHMDRAIQAWILPPSRAVLDLQRHRGDRS